MTTEQNGIKADAERVRVNPWQRQRSFFQGPKERLRYDGLVTPQSVPPTLAVPKKARKLPLVKINAPDFYIMVILNHHSTVLSEHDKDVLGAARRLAGTDGAVILLSCASQQILSESGADRVHAWPPIPQEVYAPEQKIAIILRFMEHFDPRFILFPDDPELNDLAMRVAAQIDECPATHIRAVNAEQIDRDGYNGTTTLSGPPCRVMTISAQAADPVRDILYEARFVDIHWDVPPADHYETIMLPFDPETVHLEEASLIVSAGAGLTDWQGFRRLAETLKAAIAGTRVVCDAGYLPRERQVGASGHLVSADCYIALGLSGAMQHLQGIEECQRIVAVNTDRHAPIISRSDLAYITDVNLFIEAVIHLLEGEDECR